MTPDSYPDAKELNHISKWERGDYEALMEYVGDRWNYHERCWRQDGNVYHISTAGWSGNEQLIEALQQNTTFWMMCWVSSRRGGHYEIEVI